MALTQAFATGGSVALNYNNIIQDQNSFRSTVNPFTTSTLDLTVMQPLLQGFGLALNNRNIRVAKNNVKAADYVFRQQLINSVANVVQLYWSLVAANSTVNVNQQAVAVAQKLYDDNKKQVDIGTLAPIEVVRAEAQLATAQQALVAAQSAVLQLEAGAQERTEPEWAGEPPDSGGARDTHRPDTHPGDRSHSAGSGSGFAGLGQSARHCPKQNPAGQRGYHLDRDTQSLLPTLNSVGDMRSGALAGLQNTVQGVNATTGLLSAPPIADPFFVGGYGRSWRNCLAAISRLTRSA